MYGGARYAGILMTPTGKMDRRLGFVPAIDVAYCPGQTCSLGGSYCAYGTPAGTAGCCSKRCARAGGSISVTVSGGGSGSASYTLKSSFDGDVQLQFDVCMGKPRAP